MIAAHISGPRQPTITATSAAQSTGTPGGHERREHRARPTIAPPATIHVCARTHPRREQRDECGGRGRIETEHRRIVERAARRARRSSVARFHEHEHRRARSRRSRAARRGRCPARSPSRSTRRSRAARSRPCAQPARRAAATTGATRTARCGSPSRIAWRAPGGAAPAVGHRADERELRPAREHQQPRARTLGGSENPPAAASRAERESVRAGRRRRHRARRGRCVCA